MQMGWCQACRDEALEELAAIFADLKKRCVPDPPKSFIDKDL
jgi:hypothetical protein